MHNRTNDAGRLGLALMLASLVLAWLVACGGGGTPPAPPAAQPFPPVTLDAAGGQVDGPDGLRVVVPAGALAAPTSIALTEDDGRAPAWPSLPAGFSRVGPLYALTPHGTEFGAPAQLSLPRPAVPAGAQVLLLKTNAANDGWQQLDTEEGSDGRVQAPITGFSTIGYLVCDCGGAGNSPPPAIATPPRSGALDEGGYLLLSVDAIGAAPFTYQWRRNGSPLAGETGRALVINPVALADDGMRLSVTVTDTHGRSVTSPEAAVQVRPLPPVVLSEPLDAVGVAGQGVTLSALTGSSVAQTLQWERSNDGGLTWGAAPSQSPQLALSGLQVPIDDGALFRLVARNVRGSVATRAARLQVLPALSAPVVLAEPVAAEAWVGRSASFHVVASGGSLQHEWQRSDNGGGFLPIAGAPDAATYTLSNVRLADQGARFRVVLRNAVGTVVSAAAELRVASTVAASVVRLAGGKGHSLALRADGRLMAWGWNASGQLGLGTPAGSDQATPVAIPGLQDVAGLSAGTLHSLAVRSDGQLFAWGNNAYGQLGDGSLVDRRTPVALPRLGPTRQAVAGNSSSFAVTLAEGYAGWGSGLLGDGRFSDRLTSPQTYRVPAFVRVAAGASHQLGLRADGSVWAWGLNGQGQLGQGDRAARLAPSPISGIARVGAIAVGGLHTLLLTEAGEVLAVGRGGEGQLGQGDTASQARPVPVRLPGLAVAIAAGEGHALALLADGRLFAWGSNSRGQVGHGRPIDALQPVALVAPWRLPLQAIGAGERHSLALDAEGQVWAWGDNALFQLGDGTRTQRDTPVPVPGLRLD